MNEEEAKTKWCPMARESILNQTIDGVGIHVETCIASGCACWKWDESFGVNGNTRMNRQGHCGLTK